MAFTADINTQIAQSLGLLGQGQRAGGGAVDNALKGAGADVRAKYEAARRQYDPTYSNTQANGSFTLPQMPGAQINPQNYAQQQDGSYKYTPQPGTYTGPKSSKNFAAQGYGTTYLQDALKNYNANAKAPAAPAPAPQVPQDVQQPNKPPLQTPYQDPYLKFDWVDPKYTSNASTPAKYKSVVEQMLKPTKLTRPERMDAGQDYAGMSDPQILSGIASKGVYGSGAGDNERNLFINLLLQRVMNENNQVSDLNFSPIEGSFLDYLNVNRGDQESFLRSIQPYLSN